MIVLEVLVAVAGLLAVVVSTHRLRRRMGIRRAERRLEQIARLPHPDSIPRAADPPRSIRRGHRRRGAIRKTRRGRWDRFA